jgi:signal transduction histidine kinase
MTRTYCERVQDMTRSPFRFPLAEACAVLGGFFGAWLIHIAFQPAADSGAQTEFGNQGLLGIGALDMLLCFGVLGYLLRARLREGKPLPKSWIVAGAVLIACFLGWIAALLLDADRLGAQQQYHTESLQQLVKLEDSLRHFSDSGSQAELGNQGQRNPGQTSEISKTSEVSTRLAVRNAWQVNHDRYARLHDQLHASLRVNPAWDEELTRIDDEVQQMHKQFSFILAENDALTPNPSLRGRGETERLKWHNDFQQTRERAVVKTEALRLEIAQGERGLAVTYRARWRAVGASALIGVVLLLGCLLFWLLVDRELRRSWKTQSRLAGDDARFRWLVEKQKLKAAEARLAELECECAAWQEREQHARDEAQRLSEHEEQKKSYETTLGERQKQLKQLEIQVREQDQHREELVATLRDHQERLHQMDETQHSHEASLKASKEATRRLASGIANDFNNVLSIVLGNTEVLRDNLPKDHVAQNYLDEIHQAAGRGTDLSQRLIAFSRNHLLQMVPIEMNQQLAGLESKIHLVLGPVQLQWERSEQELWVKTDPHPLEEAILHLVTHARLHMPQEGTLTIHTSQVELTRAELTHADMAPGAYIQLRLQDTGAGIDEETLPHVFEPYHPIHEGQKPDLALATAYGILRQSGGCIDVTSEKGKSSQWTILLPETAERPQHAEQETPLRASA